MRRNFRRSRKFWHCDKDELATRLSIGSATPLSPFLSLSLGLFCFSGLFMQLPFATLSACGCCCSRCPCTRCRQWALVSARHFFAADSAIFSLCCRDSKHEKSISKFMYTQIESAQRVQEKWVKTRKAAHTKKINKRKTAKKWKTWLHCSHCCSCNIYRMFNHRGKTTSENAFK